MAGDRSKILQQAQLLASRGQYDAAIAEWKKLAADAPNDGSIHNSIGDLHVKRNAPAEATTAFLQAAAAFRAEGATLKAIAAYKKVLKIDPTRYEVYRHLGDLNAERGLLSSAVQDYLTLGKYYLKERRSKEALEIYKKIVSQDPSNLDAQQRVAELCVQENLQDEATRVYLQLGRERSAQGRYDEAKDAYLAVLRIDPKNSEAAQFVESVQKGGTGGVKAAKSAAAVPGHRPSEPFDLLAEATRRIEEKQYAGAEAILNQLLTREPGNPQVCQLLARLHLQRGDVQVALGEYRFLAGAALRAQDYLLAESLITEFLTAEPDSVPLLELLGELYAEKGDAAAAAAQYARAVEILLDHPESGMESLHEELFEKVKALSPDPALVQRLAARLAGGRGEAAEAVPEPIAFGEPKADTVNGFSLVGAQPDEFWSKPRPFSTVSSFATEDAPTEVRAFKAHDLSVMSEVSAEHSPAESVGASAKLLGEGGASTEPTKQVVARATADSTDQAQPQTMVQSIIELGREAIPPKDPDATPLPDWEAHFTLGVAYKHMGLYEEAKEEFEVAKGADSFYLDACLMTALCFKEEKQPAQAIKGLEAVLSDPRCQGAKGQAIRYELGLLYEAEAQWEKAARTYHSIPSFHDVPRRLELLKERSGSTAFRLAS